MKYDSKFFSTVALLTLTALLNHNTLYAQKNAIKTNLASIHQFGCSYERAVQKKTTLQLEFQKWNQTNHSSSSYELLGVSSTTDKSVNIKGGRVEMTARRYRRRALDSGFLEGGIYFGKHQVTVTENTTDFSPISLLFLNFDQFLSTNTTTKEYKDVVVAGGKIGLGFQKNLGILSVELSGGANLNAFNSKNVRPSLPLKGISPYGRFSLGVAF